MTTLIDLENRIADDLQRTDLSTQIQQSILTAIQKYERQRFYFNQTRVPGAFTTVQGQEFYTVTDSPLISSLAQIDRVNVLVSGNRYTMNPRTPQYLEDISVNPTVQGQPIDYAYYSESIRMYPIPDNAYPVTLMGTVRETTLVNPTDQNNWTIDAEPLIRSRAKLELFVHVLRDTAQAQLMKLAEEDALADIKAETMRRSSKRFKPTQF